MNDFALRRLAAGAGAVFDFDNWSLDNYVLLPAAVYQGNNFAVMDMIPVQTKYYEYA